MTPYYPVLLYFPLCLIVFLSINNSNMFKNHTSVIFFLFFMLLGYLNVFFIDYYVDINPSFFYFRAIDFISEKQITQSSYIYLFSLTLTIFTYAILYKWSPNKKKIIKSTLSWEHYTSKEYIKIKNIALITGISCYILFFILRFGYYGLENAYAPARAISKEDVFEASYGKSQSIAGLFLSITTIMLFICIELKLKWQSILLFVLISVMPIINASKTGFIIIIFYILIYLFLRQRIKFKFYYVFLVLILLVPSFYVGEISRASFQGWSFGDFTAFSWIEGIVRRDTSLGQTIIMLSDYNFYSGLISQYREAMVGLAVPSFIWPDKPNTPGYDIALLFGFGVQSSAPGWLGGFLFVFGTYGIILGPLIIGYTLSLFSRHFSFSRPDISVKYPILFFILIQVCSWFMDGQYHSVLANIITIIVQLIVIFIFILMINFVATIPPNLKKIYRFINPN